MSIYLFDMDGTLTPPASPMDASFAAFFYDWQQSHKSYIATGSKYDKVVKRFDPKILNSFTGIYASMGNELIAQGKVVYQKKFEPPRLLYEKLENYRKNTAYPNQLYPNYIEDRAGMINFSILGRDCPREARLKYSKWDRDTKEREKIVNELRQFYPQYDIDIGGPISVDIMPKGCGKEQVANHLRKLYPNEKIIFLGDQIFVGGNDYKLACTLSLLPNTQIVQINMPEDVLKFLQND